jgi:hypothetical protein
VSVGDGIGVERRWSLPVTGEVTAQHVEWTGSTYHVLVTARDEGLDRLVVLDSDFRDEDSDIGIHQVDLEDVGWLEGVAWNRDRFALLHVADGVLRATILGCR